MAITAAQAAAKGKGFVDKNHPLFGTAGFVGPEDDDEATAPAPAPATPPAQPAAPAIPPPPPVAPPPRQAEPALGPLVADPSTGAATHDPTQAIPPPAATPGRMATPSLGPLVANPETGTATHNPDAPVAGPVSSDPAPAPAGPSGPPKTVNEAFKKALLDRLNKPVGVDPNDPTIKAQTDAFNVAQQRAKERARADMAERVSSNGGVGVDSGGFEGGLRGLEEQQGEAEGAFAANLTGQELQRQYDELTRYMAMAGDQLNAEESRALQERLGNLQAQMQREGLKQSGTQFDKGLSEQQRQFDIESALKKHGIDVNAGQFDRSLLEQGREADLDAEMKRRGIDLQGELGHLDNDTRLHGIDVNSMLGLLQLLMGRQNFVDGESGTNARFGAGMDADLWRTLLGGLG